MTSRLPAVYGALPGTSSAPTPSSRALSICWVCPAVEKQTKIKYGLARQKPKWVTIGKYDRPVINHVKILLVDDQCSWHHGNHTHVAITSRALVSLTILTVLRGFLCVPINIHYLLLGGGGGIFPQI